MVEEHFGDRVIAALGGPVALAVAAALVQRDRHLVGDIGKRLVDLCGIALEQLLRILAPGADEFAMRRIADERDAGVVHLEVARPGVDKRLQLLPVRSDQVVPEQFIVFVDAEVSAGVIMHAVRRRHGHLGQRLGVCLQEFERTHD